MLDRRGGGEEKEKAKSGRNCKDPERRGEKEKKRRYRLGQGARSQRGMRGLERKGGGKGRDYLSGAREEGKGRKESTRNEGGRKKRRRQRAGLSARR